ncbi:hypothetical protein BB560_003865 [Smittium megazygosporum]|uniref:Uncharacterized protein n=1 Tax=Smittium megazygosporum TaxID=133381 RepID=A0A2T9ZAW9_9FUNG|nr:hypothetical protein BB560_003865 [Smittium megazygosporum]
MSADVKDAGKSNTQKGLKLVQYQRSKFSSENKESAVVEEIVSQATEKETLSFAKILGSKDQAEPLSKEQSTSATVNQIDAPTTPNSHPLQYSWTFWYMHREPGQKIVDYEASTIKIGSFFTVEEFWNVYTHTIRPNDMPIILDLHLFRFGVRPVWEDEMNINGGKWMIRIKKGLASRLWERLVLGIIGNQFEHFDQVCGAVLSIRNSEDIISLWNKTAHDAAINISIRDSIKSILGISHDTIMEYKAHNDSLRDNSSFRNTDIYKT